MSIILAAVAATTPVPADYRLPEAEPVEIIVPVEGPVITERQDNGIEQRRIAFHALNAADLATTVYCIEAHGCTEGNPLYGQHSERAVLGKVLTAVAYELLLDDLRDSGNLNAIRWFQYSSIVITGGVVAWNIKVLM